MYNFLITSMIALSFFSVKAAHSEENKISRLRVDCRFYGEEKREEGRHEEAHHEQEKMPFFCYASAKYELHGKYITNISYGVGCDNETLYDSCTGTSEPQDLASDTIRPKTAMSPAIRLSPQGTLQTPGTYPAQLQLASQTLNNGLCSVSEITEEEPYGFL